MVTNTKKEQKITKNFKSTTGLNNQAIQEISTLLKTGQFYRYYNYETIYNDKEELTIGHEPVESEVARLEKAVSAFTGHPYIIGVNSCGSAMFLALKALGIKQGEKVLTNSFTFTAVPSSIVHAGGVPVYVECNRNYVISLKDLKSKMEEHPDAKYFLLSHMRGHIADMDAVKAMCDENNIYLIEDAAHSMGTQWLNTSNNEYKHMGHHGQVTCFSTQSYKLLNSGEGGFIATHDEKIAAYCILAAGAYQGIHQQNGTIPDNQSLFERIKYHVPNFSVRMSNLTAIVLYHQLKQVDEQIVHYNKNYHLLEKLLSNETAIELPTMTPQAVRVSNSMQFNLKNLTTAQIDEFIALTKKQGVKIAIFGREDNARFFKTWKYSFEKTPILTQTETILYAACDIRLPLSFDENDIRLVAKIILKAIEKIKSSD